MHFAAAHPACGAAVATELPDGYPVQEGVGLWCPACREAWWAEAEQAERDAEPEADVEPEAEAEPGPGPGPGPGPKPRAEPEPEDRGKSREIVAPATITRLLPPAPPAPAPASAPAPAPAPARTPAPRPGPGPLRRWWAALAALGVFVTLAVVVALSAVDPDGSGTRALARPAVPEPIPTVAPTASPAPTPAAPATVTRTVAGRAVTARVPDGWTVRRRDRGLTYAGPGGVRVRVTAGPRRGRDLRRLGRDARRALGRPRAPQRRVRLGGRPGVEVRGAGQVLVQVPDGRRRWLISRPAAAGGDVARSVRIRRTGA